MYPERDPPEFNKVRHRHDSSIDEDMIRHFFWVFSHTNVEQEGERSPSINMPPPPEDTTDVQLPAHDQTEQTTQEMPNQLTSPMNMYRSYHGPSNPTDMPTSVQVQIHILPLGKIIGVMPRLTDDVFLITPATTYIEFKKTIEAREERLLKPGSATERSKSSRLVWDDDKGQNEGTFKDAKEEILAGRGTELYIGTYLIGPYGRDQNSTHHVVEGMLAMPAGCDDRTARAQYTGCEGNMEWIAEKRKQQWQDEETGLAQEGDFAGAQMRLDCIKEETGLAQEEDCTARPIAPLVPLVVLDDQRAATTAGATDTGATDTAATATAATTTAATATADPKDLPRYFWPSFGPM
ncbi:hypothetical protein LTR56_020284 [Elasticomyces elasticus]|nr:hypothetical protein LTR56_020284 [Elasticomyces elasticus]KAK3644552.1 hypothetical protein LTR22_015150 [Elasticomyces elasticus]KAK4910404.1 hypothetical protein LTR49_020920 [Elasticomyces elasticus]KAK5750069.1 hypothetical protein LTS12_019874 [Elasticomyces elasticus]